MRALILFIALFISGPSFARFSFLINNVELPQGARLYLSTPTKPDFKTEKELMLTNVQDAFGPVKRIFREILANQGREFDESNLPNEDLMIFVLGDAFMILKRNNFEILDHHNIHGADSFPQFFSNVFSPEAIAQRAVKIYENIQENEAIQWLWALSNARFIFATNNVFELLREVEKVRNMIPRPSLAQLEELESAWGLLSSQWPNGISSLELGKFVAYDIMLPQNLGMLPETLPQGLENITGNYLEKDSELNSELGLLFGGEGLGSRMRLIVQGLLQKQSGAVVYGKKLSGKTTTLNYAFKQMVLGNVGKDYLAKRPKFHNLTDNVTQILRLDIAGAFDVPGQSNAVDSIINILKERPHIALYIPNTDRLLNSRYRTALERLDELVPTLRNPIFMEVSAFKLEKWKDLAPEMSKRFTGHEIETVAPDAKSEELQSILNVHIEAAKYEYDLGMSVDSIKHFLTRNLYFLNHLLPGSLTQLVNPLFQWALVQTTSDSISPEDIDRFLISSDLIPEKILKYKDHEKGLEDHLQNEVKGQHLAIMRTLKALSHLALGIMFPDRPIASYLFYGPTGIGKTKLAIALAKYLNLNIVRLDMTEFSESHSISKLIGAPAGYVGYEEPGRFKEISRKPYSLVIFDEIEKAHPDVQRILIGILENGIVVGNQGEIYDFRHTIVVATSNATSSESKKGTLGVSLGEEDDREKLMARLKEAIERSFPLELLNRFSAIIDFSQIDEDAAHEIVKTLLADFRVLFQEFNINIEFDSEIEQFLVNKSDYKTFGGRRINLDIRRDTFDLIYETLREEQDLTKSYRISIKDGKLSMDSLEGAVK